MSMKITERLKAEHGVFLFQLGHLQSLARSGAPRDTLKAVMEAIATAEERHSVIEDGLLYPALARLVGRDFALLRRSKAEREELQEVLARIRSGAFDEGLVDAFAEGLRAHLESEIHDVFALAEDMIPAEELEAMSNWDVDHIYEVNANRRRSLECVVIPGAP
jgi:hemerythrin-like domain-containing protein